MAGTTFNQLLGIHKAHTFFEIAKFNPYHGKDGRFTSAGNSVGPTIQVNKYSNLIPKDSYINTPEFQKAYDGFSDSINKHDKAYDEYKKIREQIKTLPNKPKDEWTMEDEFQSILGNRPKIGAEKLIEEKEKAFAEVQKYGKLRDEYSEKMNEIKTIAHNQQISEYTYTKPKPATQKEYDGFKTDDTGTSYYNDILTGERRSKSYLAEMSPKEYIKRCAFDIFDNATIESTIHGTNSDNVAKYTKMMAEGTKFDLPYLNYQSQNQEGRHRALAAYNLGIEKIPVLIVEN